MAKCWDRKQQQNYRKRQGAYAAALDSDDETGGEYYEDEHEEEAEGYEEDSEAFIAQHLGELGLQKKKEKVKKYVDVNFTLVTMDTFLEKGKMKEIKNKVLLDTGCVRTVCGQMWLAHVMSTMDPEVKKTGSFWK